MPLFLKEDLEGRDTRDSQCISQKAKRCRSRTGKSFVGGGITQACQVARQGFWELVDNDERIF